MHVHLARTICNHNKVAPDTVHEERVFVSHELADVRSSKRLWKFAVISCWTNELPWQIVVSDDSRASVDEHHCSDSLSPSSFQPFPQPLSTGTLFASSFSTIYILLTNANDIFSDQSNVGFKMEKLFSRRVLRIEMDTLEFWILWWAISRIETEMKFEIQNTLKILHSWKTQKYS